MSPANGSAGAPLANPLGGPTTIEGPGLSAGTLNSRSKYDQSGRMFSAWGPLGPWVMSNSTFWFSSSER